MISLYVFSLVLGGGFLGLSLLGDLFGGHGDVDLDVDVDLDMDVDAGGDLDLHHTDVAVHDHGHLASKIFSIRTITYSLFGFGAVGTLLTWLWAGTAATTTLLLAIGTGLTSGALISSAFVWVKRSESGRLDTEDAFEGHVGRVTLPVSDSGGLVLVEKAGKEIELRALPHPSAAGRGDAASWRQVVVVEMHHGIALVAPLDGEPLLKP
jgi:hypothetical protein